jgi:hypothetical protein
MSTIMNSQSTSCEARNVQTTAVCSEITMRCATVAGQLSLAVIKLGRAPQVLEKALTGCLLKIAGVSQVHVDALRNTVQVLYDGEQDTVQNVHCFLVATGWDEGVARVTKRVGPARG